MFNRKSEMDDVLISAYVDGRLSGNEQTAFEARLGSEPALKRQMDATRLLVGAAREMPAARLPRNFTIQAGTQPRQSVAPFAWWLRAGSALAAAVFVIAVGIDVIGVTPQPQAMKVAPQAPQVSMAAASPTRATLDGAARAAPITAPGATPSAAPESTQVPEAARPPAAAEEREATPISASEPSGPLPEAHKARAPQATESRAAPSGAATTDQMPATEMPTTPDAAQSFAVAPPDQSPSPEPEPAAPTLTAMPELTATPPAPGAPSAAVESVASPPVWPRLTAGAALIAAIGLGILGWRRP